MRNFSIKLFSSLIGLALVTVLPACNDGEFAGGSGAAKRLTGGENANGKGIKDGKDPNDLDGDGIAERDLDGDGIPDIDRNNNGIPDSKEGTTNDPDSLEDGDGSTSSSLYHDLELMQNEEDEKHSIKIETIVDGKTIRTTEHKAPGKGKSIKFEKACRNQGKTCLKVTMIGKVTETVGQTKCAKMKSSSGKSAVVIADVDGVTLIGSCLGGGSDEEHTLTCPNSESLAVTGC